MGGGASTLGGVCQFACWCVIIMGTPLSVHDPPLSPPPVAVSCYGSSVPCRFLLLIVSAVSAVV